MTTPPTRRLLGRGSYLESLRVGEILRKETTGGLILMAAAVVAIVWANSPAADSYFALRDLEVGIESLHLKLSLGAWAADGLLAIFFFLVGLELKHEFVAGDLRDPKRALVPMVAAAAGVAVPAALYALVNAGSPGTLQGWAIPAATDIAFAVAVLAIVGTHLPSALLEQDLIDQLQHAFSANARQVLLFDVARVHGPPHDHLDLPHGDLLAVDLRRIPGGEHAIDPTGPERIGLGTEEEDEHDDQHPEEDEDHETLRLLSEFREHA